MLIRSVFSGSLFFLSLGVDGGSFCIATLLLSSTVRFVMKLDGVGGVSVNDDGRDELRRF